jgi:hypothetical protein
METSRLLLPLGVVSVLSNLVPTADYRCLPATPSAAGDIQKPFTLHTSKYNSNGYMTSLLLKNETNYKPLVSQSLFYILEH